jgi:hypothetical protein
MRKNRKIYPQKPHQGVETTQNEMKVEKRNERKTQFKTIYLFC